MKENVLDVLMYLFENYFYDEPDEEPDRESMEENLHEAGFSNGEIDKAFEWLDGLAEQRFQPEFGGSRQAIRVFIESEARRGHDLP
jgi:Smg protein